MQLKYKRPEPVPTLFADAELGLRNTIRIYAASQADVEIRATLATGRQVLAALQAGPCPEVLVLDALLQDMNLFDLLAEIGRMELKPHPAILVTAMRLSPQQQDRLLTAGCDSFILKPYSLNMLFAMVVNHAADSQAFTQRRVDRLLDWHLSALRADFSSKGVDYIRCVMQVLVPAGSAIPFNELYEQIAEGEAINCEGVVTAVRRTIKQLQSRQTEEYRDMCAYYGKHSEQGLTNAEFLSLLAQRVRQELRG
ncbi:MAG: response regulator [Gemmiger sp.]|nr:response regulator [Gemmiger sp.]